MEVKIENGKMYVKSKYNREFISQARMVQGKWNSPYWEFPEENEKQVRDLLLNVYGENGLEQNTVDILLHLDEYKGGTDEKITIGKYIVASRPGRDWQVKLDDKVILVAGGFSASGGSVKNPRVSPATGTILKVKGLPDDLYHQIADKKGVKLIAPEDPKAKLLKEKEKLMKRLAEIEKELEKQVC